MDTRPVDSWTLRPLSIGEMLDRAVTLTVRNFGLLAMIALAYAIPQAFFSYYGTQDQSALMGGFVDMMRDSVAGKPVNFDALIKAQRQATVFNGWTVLLYSWLLVGLPIYSTAMVYAASCRYRGLAVDARESYRITLQRWGTLVGITLVYFVLLMMALFVLVFAALSILFALTFLSAAVRNTVVINAAILLIAIVTIVMSFAIMLLTTMSYLSLHFAWMASVFEGSPLVPAVASSFARVFGQPFFRRSALFTLAYCVIAGGYTIFVFAGVGLIGSLLHSEVAGIAFATVLEVGVATFFAALFMVYYYDIRVRREGLDLELEAAALEPAPAPALA